MTECNRKSGPYTCSCGQEAWKSLHLKNTQQGSKVTLRKKRGRTCPLGPIFVALVKRCRGELDNRKFGQDPLATDSIADPLTRYSIADRLATDSIADPLATDSIADPLATDSIADPLTRYSIADPLTTDSIADPLATDAVAKLQVQASVTELEAGRWVSDCLCVGQRDAC